MKLEREGVILAVLMAAAALGLELEQRLTRSSSPPAPPPFSAPATPDVGEKIEPLPVEPGGHEFVAKDGKLPRMQGFAKGRKQYEFSMQRLVQAPGGREVSGEGAEGVLLGPTGQATVRFSAERATLDTVTKDLDIEGHVRVESMDPKNPVAFETRDVQWKAAAEQLVCPNPVEVAQRGSILRGSKMVADAKLRKLKLDKGIVLEADVDEVKRSLEALRKARGGSGAPTRSGGRR